MAEFPLPQNPQKLSFFAQIGYYSIEAMAALHTGNTQAAGAAFGEVVQCWQSRPVLISVHPTRYSNALANYLSCHYSLEDEADFLHALTLASNTEGLDARAKTMVRIKTLNLELLNHLNRNRIYFALEIARQIEAILEKQPGLMEDASEVVYRYNLGVVYFVNQDYAKAHKKWVHILAFAPKEIRVDIRQAALFLQWLGYLERGELVQFERNMHGVRHRLKQGQTNQGFLLVHRALQQAPDYQLSKAQAQSLILTLKALSGLGIVEIIRWLEQK
ncbi:MAG TPA: hypothetical protein ENJ82_14220 [Bacteroidetes bacterium]|nr:hypothetical protein [Bacteroidota bacterium]